MGDLNLLIAYLENTALQKIDIEYSINNDFD